MSEQPERSDKAARRARLLGVCLQGLVLGALLTVALTELWVQAEDVRLFRYQAF